MRLFILLSPVGVFRTILFIAIVYVIIKIFSRHILPVVMQNKLKEYQKKMESERRSRQPENKPEGEVTIEFTEKKKRSRQDEGEYIDFEEVE